MPYASRTINTNHLTINKVQEAKHFSQKRQVSSVKCQVSSLGFTLIELLVVMGILGVAVGSTLMILTSILRGSNQANILAEVKQNGQVVLDGLERQIRGASDATEINPTHIKLLVAGSDPLQIKCFPSGGLFPNGWIGTVISSDETLPATSFTSITNTDSVTGVNIQNCTFTVIGSGVNSTPVVRIKFVASQGVGASTRADFNANADFNTTISLRRY